MGLIVLLFIDEYCIWCGYRFSIYIYVYHVALNLFSNTYYNALNLYLHNSCSMLNHN